MKSNFKFMATLLSVSEVLSMCYNSDFGLSEDEPDVTKERRAIPTDGHEL